jgi:hypothetical protein
MMACDTRGWDPCQRVVDHSRGIVTGQARRPDRTEALTESTFSLKRQLGIAWTGDNT